MSMNLWQMLKAYSGMVFGHKDYWHPDMNANPNVRPGKLGFYPVDMSAKADYPGIFDAELIPLVQMGEEHRYLPVTIAQYALGNYDRYMAQGGPDYLTVLLRCADWLSENLRENRNVWGWLNDFDKDSYALSKPWLSALGQGQALSVLARAYLETGEEKYRQTATRALEAFFVPVTQGGLVAKYEGDDFYEEYPSAIPSLVLNGFIFALWGLYDWYLASSDQSAYERYTAGLETLKRIAVKYQVQGLTWSRYDLYPYRVANIASIFYHKLHIQQLLAITRLTGDPCYAELAGKWMKRKNNPLVYFLATFWKVMHKLSVRRESTYVPSIK